MHVIGCTRVNSFHVTLVTGRKRVYSGDIYLLTHSKHTQHVHRHTGYTVNVLQTV